MAAFSGLPNATKRLLLYPSGSFILKKPTLEARLSNTVRSGDCLLPAQPYQIHGFSGN